MPTLSTYEKTPYEQFLTTCQAEGYTEVMTGSGGWIDGTRILSIAAIFHPDGKVKTWENSKHEMGSRSPRYGYTFASSTEFQTYCDKSNVTMRDERVVIAEEISASNA